MNMVFKCLAPVCIPIGRNSEDSSWTVIDVDKEKGLLTVLLIKGRKESSFGLTIAGGTDKDRNPYISHIKPGGLADRCDYFSVNDEILEISDCKVSWLLHADVIKIVQDAGKSLKLKTSYRLCATDDLKLKWKRFGMFLNAGSCGPEFSVKGGLSKDRILERPTLISDVLRGSETEKQGKLFTNDKLLSINGRSVHTLQKTVVNDILSSLSGGFHIEIEYPVNVRDCMQTECGFLVEIKRVDSTIPLGLDLGVSYEFESYGSSIVIADVKEAGLADRSGHLFVGDLIISINSVLMDGLSLLHATQLLHAATDARFEVFPLRRLRQETPTSSETASAADMGSGRLTLNHATRSAPDIFRDTSLHVASRPSPGMRRTSTGRVVLPSERTYPCTPPKSKPLTLDSPCSSARSFRSHFPSPHFVRTNVLGEHGHVTLRNSVLGVMSTRCESVTVTFECDGSEVGVEVVRRVVLERFQLIVDSVKPGKEAERYGVIQAGDRILSVNGIKTDYMDESEFQTYLEERKESVTLEVEFDISDSVVLAMGIFTVKMKKGASGLGIVLGAPSWNESERSLRILDVRKGSVAYRLGMLSPGDQVLSLNGRSLSNLTPEKANRQIAASPDPVFLTIKKDEEVQGATFAVELCGEGHALGLSISGSEDPFEVVRISGISEEGLAFKSGGIHVGDKILAINDVTLRGKNVALARDLLNTAGIRVKLLIKRDAPPKACKEDAGKARHRACSRQKHPKKFTEGTGSSSDVDDECGSSCDSSSVASILSAASTCSKHGGGAESSSPAEELFNLAGVKRNAPRPPSGCSLTLPLLTPLTKLYQGAPLELPQSDSLVAQSAGIELCSRRSRSIDLKQASDCKPLVAGVRTHRLVEQQCFGSLSESDPARINIKKVPFLQSKCLRLPGQYIERPLLKFNDHLTDRNPGGIRGTIGDRETGSSATGHVINACSAEGEYMSCQPNDAACSSKTPTALEGLGRALAAIRPSLREEKASSSSQAHGHTNRLIDHQNHGHPVMRRTCSLPEPCSNRSRSSSIAHRALLRKENPCDDFGFSVSDSLSGKGVFIRSVQVGSLAAEAGKLKKFDRILRVNGVACRDLNCEQLVPILQGVGEKLDIIVERKIASHCF